MYKVSVCLLIMASPTQDLPLLALSPSIVLLQNDQDHTIESSSHAQPETRLLTAQISHSHQNRMHVAASNSSLQGHRGVLHRIGTWWLLLSTLSTVSLLAAITFLSWMWMTDRNDSSWRRLMLGSFALQSITLSALAIRTALSNLAITATSMIASVALEGRGVPIEASAEVSIARFSNTGPTSFIRLLLSRNSMEAPLRLLAALLIISTLASQFTSTLLFSDVVQGVIIDFPINVTTGFGYLGQYPDDAALNYVNTAWTNSPTQFQAFAEYSEVGATGDGIDDTGLTLRSLLPITTQAARESLHLFQGLAPTFDARVICVRPNITNLALCDDEYICGDIKPELTTSDLVVYDDYTSFSCYLMGGDGWQLCPITASLGQAGSVLPVLDPTNNQSLTHTYVPDTGWVASNANASWPIHLGNSYLVIDGGHYYPSFTSWSPYNITSSSFAQAGPWLHITSTVSGAADPETLELDFNATICYDAL
jgi:hypothetical protein